MNRFFLFTIILLVFQGCQQNEFVVIPELPAVPFVWAFYVENSKTTYAQGVEYDDFYGDRPILSTYENIFLNNNNYTIYLEKNNVPLAQYEHFIQVDTIVDIYQNAGSEPDTFYRYRLPTIYNYMANVSSTTPDKTGDIFELTAQHPEYGDMYAQQKMPKKVPVDKLEVLKIESFDELFIQLNIQITINDPSEMANYYEITAAVLPRDNTGKITTKDIGIIPFEIGADDPEIIDFDDVIINRSSIYLADKSFNGKEKQITFKVGPFYGTKIPEDFHIIWRCVSPEWYRFFEARRSSFENPFLSNNNNLTQPYSLPFNIKGDGFGLFGVGTEEIYKVE